MPDSIIRSGTWRFPMCACPDGHTRDALVTALTHAILNELANLVSGPQV